MVMNIVSDLFLYRILNYNVCISDDYCYGGFGCIYDMGSIVFINKNSLMQII